MRDAIATIPMSPMHSKKLGFFSIFVYLHKFAEANSVAKVYGINILGKTGTSKPLSDFKTSIDSLEIPPDEWWIDTCLTSTTIQEKLHRMYYADKIFQEDFCEISRCSCGNIEHLTKAVLRGKKTLMNGNRSLCCDSLITSKKEKVLLTKPLPYIQITTAFPFWVKKELNEILKKIAGMQILVSRNSTRLHSLNTSDGIWQIDNDFLWWLYPNWLSDAGYRLKHLVIGPSILYQAGIMLAFSTLLGFAVPECVHCLPKVFFGATADIQNISQAISAFGKDVVLNTLYWCSLSQRKDVTLLHNLFPTMNSKHFCCVTASSRNVLRV